MPDEPREERTVLLRDKETDKEVAYPLPVPADAPSFWAYSFHKAGSTLLEKILIDCCEAAGRPVVNVPGFLFDHGMSEDVAPSVLAPLWHPDGYAYLGFRTPMLPDREVLEQAPSVLLVRDPRDRLVSYYFSLAFSHTAPPSEKSGMWNRLQDLARSLMGSPKTDSKLSRNEQFNQVRQQVASTAINEWIRNEQRLARFEAVLEKYRKGLCPSRTRIYRYEDIIFRKQEWMQDMLAHLQLELPTDTLNAIVEKHDVRPDKEDAKAHIRQVAPGNYKRHLTVETVELLDGILHEHLSLFGYDNNTSGDATPIAISDSPQFSGRFFLNAEGSPSAAASS